MIRNDTALVTFLGVRFHNIGLDATLRQTIERRENEPFEYVVTPNVDHLVRIGEGNPEILRIYNAAWISVCDSRVLTALARLVGLTMPTVSGVDLSEALLDEMAATGNVIGVIGSSSEALDVVRARYPRLSFRQYIPPMNFIRDDREVEKTLAFMKAYPARFWVISVGSPQQEQLAYLASREDGMTGVGFCVGNTINFLADPGMRAPMWMRRWALEWLYRLITEPRRLWRRYLIDGVRIVPIFVRAALSGTAVRKGSGKFECVSTLR